MTDAELWQACVESGFVASEWWPGHADGSGARWTLMYEHEEWISKSGIVYCSEGNLNARSRILSALVEWATTDLRILNAGFARCSVSHKGGVQHFGEGNLTTALLACYRQHKENA